MAVEAPLRACRRCRVAKLSTEFSKKASRADGLQVNCKPCGVILNREWRDANPGRDAAYSRAWERKNPEKVAAMRERRRSSGAGSAAARQSRYGMTPAQFEALLADQQGLCACCGTADSGRRWHVDHDHACCPGTRTCGKCVRGILCFRCNAGIGLFKDNAAALRQAAEYIECARPVADADGG